MQLSFESPWVACLDSLDCMKETQFKLAQGENGLIGGPLCLQWGGHGMSYWKNGQLSSNHVCESTAYCLQSSGSLSVLILCSWL